jgi:hypothetical protein
MKRAASEELGEGDWAITYNRNGRPVRKSAGKKTPDPGYVDSKALDDELSDFVDEYLSEEEPEELEEEPPIKRKAKKQKRAPSPTPPPLSPLPPADVSSGRSSPEPLDIGEPMQQLVDLEPISMTFNIQPGFSGPLTIQLDLSNVPLRVKCAGKRGQEAVATKAAKAVSMALNQDKKGFLTFPPGESDFRHVQYEHDFHASSDFWKRIDLCPQCSNFRNIWLIIYRTTKQSIPSPLQRHMQS